MEQMFYKEVIKEIHEGTCEYEIIRETSLGNEPTRFYLIVKRGDETFKVYLKPREVAMFDFLVNSRKNCKKIEFR